jgi:hypothetical protein
MKGKVDLPLNTRIPEPVILGRLDAVQALSLPDVEGNEDFVDELGGSGDRVRIVGGKPCRRAEMMESVIMELDVHRRESMPCPAPADKAWRGRVRRGRRSARVGDESPRP